MRLHHSPTSPFVRKVEVLLIETGQNADVTIMPASGNPVDPGTMPLSQNPLGKIPCLERDDGPSLFDSRVICRYLDARAGGRLYPDPPRLWETLTLEAMADGILDAALLIVYEDRVRPEEKQYAPWVEGQWAKIDRALNAVADRWMPHLLGPLDMGQIALACALGYLDFRHAAHGWRAERPALETWYEAFSQRPAFVATAPKG